MEDFGLYVVLSLIVPIVSLLLIITFKIISGKKIPNNDYTPLDYIIGQTTVEFHEEKKKRNKKMNKAMIKTSITAPRSHSSFLPQQLLFRENNTLKNPLKAAAIIPGKRTFKGFTWFSNDDFD